MSSITHHLHRTQKAAARIALCSDDTVKEILCEIARLAEENTPALLEANARDLALMDPTDPKYDRLRLSPARLMSIAADIRKVATLPSPLHRILEQKTLPNGLQLTKLTVPIGVVGVIFESRPNVTFDVFSICFRSGNAVVLKGSRDARFSNEAIVALIHGVLQKYDLQDILYLAPAEREALPEILQAEGLIDVIIPRGSQALIDFVRKNATVPVIETGAGVVHIYADASADLSQAQTIITHSKARRVSVCNALDCLVLHEALLPHLGALLRELNDYHHCEIFADERAYNALCGSYATDLLHPAEPTHYGMEFLAMKMAIKTVRNIEEALAHIATYSSKHSEAILARDPEAIEKFLRHTDAAVVYANAATTFTDGGEFGMGAEIGISTQKLHARGPMALPELTSYKWIVRGDGQIRK